MRAMRGLAESAAGARAVQSGDLGALARVLDERAQALSAADDPNAPFVRAYALYISDLREAMSSGELGAEDWIERLMVDLVQQYLGALRSWSEGDLATTPAPWRLVFAAQRHEPMTMLSRVRTALRAHIQYDVPLAIARVGPGVKQQRAERESAYIRVGVHVRASLPALAARLRRGANSHRLRRPPTTDLDWLADLWQRGWEDGVALCNYDEGDDRVPVFARIERSALRSLSAMLDKERRALAPRVLRRLRVAI